MLGVGQGASDCIRQTADPVFHNVIIGAIVQTLHRCFFAHGAGDENEGALGIGRPKQPQCAQPVESEQLVVGQNKVRPERFECRNEGAFGFDPLGVEFDARLTQDAYVEFRVDCTVFQ
ncbi:MAG: hypothetical protein ABI478_03765 [Propionivibrio sp.]